MRTILLLLLILLAFFGITGNYGCANMMPPSGGPRDTIGPVLVRVSPPDSTRNFREKEIIFTFDEYVDLKDAANNLIFTPTLETPPKVEPQLRTIRVRFEDPLEDSTTYVLNFGNAIVDINESNPLKGFTYIFSTGSVLDSLQISGRVLIAETGEVDSTISVVLHRDLSDSAAIQKRPPYVVKVDNAGYFRFRYLPSDTFAIYAIGGVGRTYIDKTKEFAFFDTTVIAGQADSLLLYAYVETRPKAPPAGTGGVVPGLGRNNSASDRRLRFTAPQGQQELQQDYVLEFPLPLKTFDSTKLSLTADSNFTPVSYTVALDSTRKRLRFSSAWKENTRYNLEVQKEFAADSAGRQLLKTDTLFFATKKLSDYGNLVIRFKGLDPATNPVLQLLLNGQVVRSESIRSGVFSDPQFAPGQYSLRILFDRNDNGIWDPGHFPAPKKQPEIVRPVPRTVTVKAAWDNEFDIVL